MDYLPSRQEYCQPCNKPTRQIRKIITIATNPEDYLTMYQCRSCYNILDPSGDTLGEDVITMIQNSLRRRYGLTDRPLPELVSLI